MQIEPGSGARASEKVRPSAAAIVAGLVVVGALGGWFLVRDKNAVPTIDEVAPADFRDALATIAPSAAQNARPDFEGCRFPMGMVVVSTPGNPAGGKVRISTSKYQSPWFNVTAEQQSIALPIPVPPQAGGPDVMTVEGNAMGLFVALTPGTSMDLANSARTINVYWRPRPACKS
jgi:hypothetical protein